MLLFGKNCGVGNNIEMNIAQVRTMVGTKNKFQQKSIDLLSGERSGRGKMLLLGGRIGKVLSPGGRIILPKSVLIATTLYVIFQNTLLHKKEN